MSLGKFEGHNQITLPRDIIEALGLEPGDTLEARVTERGTLELVPRRSKLERALEHFLARGGGERVQRQTDGDAVKYVREELRSEEFGEKP
jgi:bifunctional DNA-binding transcriptional regulator/antitoxin component of YhaV-PrlF toxin-antitoxin module